MTLVGRVRERRLRGAIETRRRQYEERPSAEERGRYQLDALNEQWARACAHVPRLRELRQAQGLPLRFESLAEYRELVPPMDRGTLQGREGSVASDERAGELVRTTGGTTAEPVQLPAWREEFEFTAPDMWTGRSWYGIRPSSRLFMLWGHSHLLGSGWKGWLNARKREIQDGLLGYRRFSAYDLREEPMRRAAESLIRFRPEWVIGYSVALDALARAAGDWREPLHALRLKAAVATAEGFPSPTSAGIVQDALGAPVAMEYGAVETGLVAHTRPEGGFRVFWRSYLVEIADQGGMPQILLTALFPRCVPLFRYVIGDAVEPDADTQASDGLVSFRRILGRCNAFVELPDMRVHSEAFSHAVRPVSQIRRYQILQLAGEVRLLYVSDAPLAADVEEGLRGRLARIHPDLGGIPIERADTLRQTVAGKTPMILRRDP